MSLDVFDTNGKVERGGGCVQKNELNYGMEIHNVSRFLTVRKTGIDSAMDTIEEEMTKLGIPKPEKRNRIKLIIKRVASWLPKIKLVDGKEKT